MTMETILSLAVAGFGLVTAGLYLGELTRQRACEPESEDVADDESLFCGWDGLTTHERKKRLSLYQRRIRARIAEQEREWLQARLRE